MRLQNTYWSKRPTAVVFLLAIIMCCMVGCGQERSSITAVSQEHEILLSKPAGKTIPTLPAQIGVVVRRQNLPQRDIEIAFARSISGRVTEYQWWGITDERGWVGIAISADAEIGLNKGGSGYYIAQAKDIVSQEIIGRWTSIPVNAGSTQKIVLEIGEKPQVIYEEGFAVYIAVDRIISDQSTDIDALTLLQPAFISASDIQAYRWSDHQISYSDSVWKRLQTWGSLAQHAFVVTVNGERLYWGLFLDILSSSGTRQPVIMLTIDSLPGVRSVVPPNIQIGRGYPGAFDTEPDPRRDFRIYESLLKSKILGQ